MRPGGSLAVCLPLQSCGSVSGGNELLRECAANLELSDALGLGAARALPTTDPARADATNEPVGFAARLSGPLCEELDVWSTTYTQRVAPHGDLLPDLVGVAALEPADAKRLELAYRQSVECAYTAQPNGTRLLPLGFLFVVARRPGLMDIYAEYAAYHDHQLEKGWKS